MALHLSVVYLADSHENLSLRLFYILSSEVVYYHQLVLTNVSYWNQTHITCYEEFIRGEKSFLKFIFGDFSTKAGMVLEKKNVTKRLEFGERKENDNRPCRHPPLMNSFF